MNVLREALHERLRAVAEDIIETVEDIARPKTHLEAERSARAVIIIYRMIAQLFSDAIPSSYSMCYDYEPRHEDGERGDWDSYRMPVETGVHDFDDCAKNAPIVSSAATSPATAGEDESVEALVSEFDAEKEAQANVIFAAYCEFKRLECEAEEQKARQ